MERSLLSPQETAQYLDVAERTLSAWRIKGQGPRFVRVHRRRVAYRLQDIETWLDARVHRSTSDAGGAQEARAA